jgi:predicted enzyme related to lactoylglutathione lyase
MTYEKLDVVWYTVTDWPRAKAFYEKVLGFQPTFGMDEMGWQQYRVAEGSPDLAIAKAQANQAPGNGGGAIAVLAVKNIDAARTELVAKRVPCDEITTIPNVVKLCVFRDPDGNRLQLSQALTAREEIRR